MRDKTTKYYPLCPALEFNQTEKNRCDKCDSSQFHDISWALLNTPPILIIHIEASYKDDRMVKLSQTRITRLEHILAVSNYSTDSLDPGTIQWTFYQLYGLIIRLGDAGNRGHYICAFEQRKKGQWSFFDDMNGGSPEFYTTRELDKKVREYQEGNGRIFMLMYRRLFTVATDAATVEESTKNQADIRVAAPSDEVGHPVTKDGPSGQLGLYSILWWLRVKLTWVFSYRHLNLPKDKPEAKCNVPNRLFKSLLKMMPWWLW